MRHVKLIFLMGFAAFTLIASADALAATGIISKSFKSGTVYASGSLVLGGFTTGYSDFERGASNGGNETAVSRASS